MTEYPEYNPLDEAELLPIEKEEEMTLTEVFESGHEDKFWKKLEELKEDFTQVADQLIDGENAWGLILKKIIEKL